MYDIIESPVAYWGSWRPNQLNHGCILDLLPDKHDINFIRTYISGHIEHIPSLDLLDLDKLA